MIQLQTITGLFNTKTHAQKAVQFLLGSGFMAEHIGISEQESPQEADKKDTDHTTEEQQTGRFLSSLFGSTDEVGSSTTVQVESGGNASYISVTRVTVQVQTSIETDQAVDLLKRARAVSVSKGA
ncbi:hypothetical protein [Spirosoma spitsbergense]|jgi:hypothetical protein|uniref:hypothetical protein n=1 Tax=Spirosoma spitsbergense TaxID=431554 RepID=UPI00037C456A|nr:hypothetical protein [Spirosoma spitsbergense]